MGPRRRPHQPTGTGERDLYCETCQRQQLLGAERVRHLINDEQGIAVILQCYCGKLAAVRTGVSADERRRETAFV